MTNGLSPRLLVCEGYEDKQFFKSLVQDRPFPDFKVIDTSSPDDRLGGISKFKRALNGFKLAHTVRFKSLKHIVIVADNDEDPVGNFSAVKQQVEAVFPGRSLRAPWIKTGDDPTISILMVPITVNRGVITMKNGTLEGFCCEAARQGNGAAASHIDNLLRDVGVQGWSETRIGKAWLRSNLAIRHNDPCAPLGEIFRDSRNLFDFNDATLNPLVEFLTGLA